MLEWVLALALGLAGALFVYWQQAQAARRKEEEARVKAEREAQAREALAAKKNKPKAKKVDVTAELKRKKQQEAEALEGAREHASFLFALKGHKFGVTAAAYSPNGRFLATASSDRTIRLHLRETLGDKNARAHQINIEYDHVTALSFSSDGRTLVRNMGTVELLVGTHMDIMGRSRRPREAWSSCTVRGVKCIMPAASTVPTVS